MKKAIIQVGYTSYILDTQKAIAFLELLGDAEVYENKWRKSEDGGNTHHIYPQTNESGLKELKLVPNAFYQMAKLAGKPEKES